jgi:zinc transport system ATP-binding protein
MGNTRDENVCEQQCSGFCCTKVEHFCVNFGNNKILDDINLHIHCGELTAIIGPNGGGKSTLLKAMLGDVKHTGQLNFSDAKGKHSGHPVIGYVPQNLSIDTGMPTSVLDLFMASNSKAPAWLFAPKKIKKKVYESLAIVKAEYLINRRIGALSGGELQRVLLALALDPIPDLLLLDEPVSGIDQNGLEVFYRTVSELRHNYDLSIILVSHDLDFVEKYADRVVLVNGTVLCNGSPQDVFNDEETLKIFGLSWFNNRHNHILAEGNNE